LPSARTTPILLGGLTATVPSTADYKAKDLLHFSGVTLEAGGSSVATIGTDALHLVTFPGNASGSGAITSADVLDMARVVAGADAGFAAYPLVDPDVIGDLLGDGTVDGPDGALLGRYVNGVTTPQMPTYPGTPVNKLSVAGPTVSVASTLQVGVGSRVTAPVTVVDTALPVLADAAASMVTGRAAPVKTPSPVSSLEDSPLADSRPHAGMVKDGSGNLFGTASSGGSYNDGTVFDRGGSMEWGRYALTWGIYKFIPVDGVWTLVHETTESDDDDTITTASNRKSRMRRSSPQDSSLRRSA
jgi:hypothetical protein